jgi:Flp pilus assembly protein TadG
VSLPLRAREGGQSLVEFALVFPLFMLLIFGIFDAGRLIYTYNTVSNAARDGARVAIVNQSTSGTDTCDTTSATAWSVGCALQSAIGLGLQPADVVVQYRDPTDTGPCAAPLIGCIASVEVTGTYRALTPVIGQIIGDVALTSTTKMAIERVCTNPTTPPIPHC